MLAAAAIALTGCNKQTELEINYGKTATVANGCKPNIIKYVADITLTLTKTTTDSSSDTGN